MHSNRKHLGGASAASLIQPATRWAVLFVAALFPSGGAHAAVTTRPPHKTPAVLAAPKSARMAYDFKVGETRRFKVTGLFTGHFPPFAQPGSAPVNLLAELVYAATVKSQDAKGAEVAFTVEAADINILQKDPGPDGKIDPNEELPFPLPLSDVKNSLDVVALMKRDGSVAEIRNGSGKGVAVKINFGIDPRKLFLLIFPVTFPDRALAANDTWTFDDGLLGHNPGKTTYSARIDGVTPGKKMMEYRVGEEVNSTVDDKIDKEGNPAQKPEDAVGNISGTVTATGNVSFLAPTMTAAQAGRVGGGRVTQGKINLTVALKRTLPDPDQPDKQQEVPIDVKARLTVQEIPQKKKVASAAKNAKQ